MEYRVYEHKTQYYETDQMGIIHHYNYIRWFEEARMDMMEQMGMGYAEMEKRGIISPVLSVHSEYKSMTHQMIMVTENKKHLERIPNIEIENWVHRG